MCQLLRATLTTHSSANGWLQDNTGILGNAGDAVVTRNTEN